MVEIHANGDEIELEVQGLHRLWALRRRIAFPRGAVRAVKRLPADALRGLWKGWRVPGTQLPGVIVAGTYYRDGERHFWDVRHADRAIEIELEGQPFRRLFVEVGDPDAAMRELGRG